MNQHRNTKTIQQYKDTKQRLQKETRREYWNYLENIICYDENSEKYKNKKNSGIIYETPRKTAQELHLWDKRVYLLMTQDNKQTF